MFKKNFQLLWRINQPDLTVWVILRTYINISVNRFQNKVLAEGACSKQLASKKAEWKRSNNLAQSSNQTYTLIRFRDWKEIQLQMNKLANNKSQIWVTHVYKHSAIKNIPFTNTTIWAYFNFLNLFSVLI